MAKIGIDATFNLHGGSYGHLSGFLENLILTKKKSQIVLYLNPNNKKIIDKRFLDSCTIKEVKISSLGNIFRIFWGQCLLPIISINDKIDVLFCPGNISPIIKTTKVKAQWIATIGPFCEDMYQGEKIFTKLYLNMYKFIILLSAFTSNVVIHQAEYSKQLFVKKYNFKPTKQYLIECGKDEFYKPDLKNISSKNKLSSISNQDLLYVSHIFPYKNILRLVNSFEKYKINNKSNTRLFIVGKIMNHSYYKILNETIIKRNLEKNIIFTGLASKNDLRFAYSTCKLFVFPSLCESSGYTLIEAMSCGAPILASDKTAIPDTCKNAAIYFNAYDETHLLSNLNNLLSSNKKLKIMKKNSLVRASEMINYKTATKIFMDIVEFNL